MRAILTLLAALMLLLAGCASDPTDDDPDDTMADGAGDDTGDGQSDGQTDGTDDDGSDDEGDAQNGTTDGENTPPEPMLTASIQQGEVPFNVTFDIDAADADGDNITWTLDADDDGTPDAEGEEVPGNYTHTYQTEGEFLVTLTVSDGIEETAINLTINGTEAAAGDPGFVTIVISGTITGLWTPVTGYTDDPNEHTFELIAQPSKMTATLTWDEQAADLDFGLKAPDGSDAGSSATYNEPTGLVPDYQPEEDPIVVEDPDLLSQVGTWTVTVLSAGSVEGGYTVEITFEA